MSFKMLNRYSGVFERSHFRERLRLLVRRTILYLFGLSLYVLLFGIEVSKCLPLLQFLLGETFGYFNLHHLNEEKIIQLI